MPKEKSGAKQVVYGGPSPMTPPSAELESRLKEGSLGSCNRHADCARAINRWLDNHPGKERIDIPFSFHCHDDECEDCFGS